ncbi:hypothetical protein AXH82_06780 [Microbacterium sp. PAMC 28756]|jgi:raffinose/stachyose/melibiose transport system substrate-binding protein|nr:hypothetical protein AXH82_06780 [Microbacterium sp. PAMC 28756]
MRLRTRRRATAALTVAAITALGLAACGDPGAGDADATEGEVGGTMNLATTSDRGLAPLIESFEADTGAKIEGTFAEAGALNEQLRIQITSGTAPDLFRSSPGYSSPSSVLNLQAEGNLMDLSDQPWAEFVPESFNSLQQADGGTYAFPTYGQAMLAFYNTTLFADLGIEVPTTWSEFIEACETLKDAGKVPISLGLADSYIAQFTPLALAATLVDGLEPDFYDRLEAGETSFVESEGWREVLEKTFGLIEDGYTTPSPLGMPGDPAMQQVGNGEAGMVIMPSAASPVLAGMMAGGEDEMGNFAVPATDDASETYVAFSPDYLVVNAKAKNPATALAFLEYIAEPENISSIAAATGSIPALSNAEPIDNALNNTVQPFLDEGRTAPFANHAWPGGKVAEALITTSQQVVEGSKTIDDVLAALDAAYQESLS